MTRGSEVVSGMLFGCRYHSDTCVALLGVNVPLVPKSVSTPICSQRAYFNCALCGDAVYRVMGLTAG